MAGLYLVGFAAPAFEAATCHVGETKDPARNVPRAVFASGAMAGLFFVVLPLVWLGSVGPARDGRRARCARLGPTFAPLLAGGAKAAAIWFLIANMFMGTLQPLAGASRTLSQLSEDGLLPRSWANRNRRDVPWVATAADRGPGDRRARARRPDVDDRGRQLHLPDRHQPALGRRPAAAPQRARARAALSRAARDDRARGRRRLRLAASPPASGFEQFGLPTVLLSLGAGLRRLGVLRLAARSPTAAAPACRGSSARWASSSPARWSP